MTPSLTVVVVYPDLLGTYGDGGNGTILWRRALWRGFDATLLQAPSDRPLPRGDIYCLGGGEDGPQVRAAASLSSDGMLRRAAGDGAVILGVCAGYQLIGTQFPDATGRPHDGIGLLDVSTRKGTGPRAVGELSAEPATDAPKDVDGSRLPRLSGFENHGGVTTVGTGARPLARVLSGVGNGGGDGTEGAWCGRVVGTYLHGPLLARNVGLGDLLLSWALGRDTEPGPRLLPLDDPEEEALRTERLAAVPREERRRRLAAKLYR